MSIDIAEVPAEQILYVPERKRVKRALGVHYSTPINDLYYRVMKGYKDFDIEAMAAVFELGFTLEELLEHAYSEREGMRRKVLDGVERPKETRYQGEGYEPIWMNPDGLRKASPRQNHEYKYTTRSASNLLNFDAEFPHWIWQSAGYSLALNCHETVWWVACGGRSQLYKTDKWKPARLFRVQRKFQPGEREHHFRTVMNHLAVMRRQGMRVEERER